MQDEKVELPFKNKESLPPEQKMEVSKRKYNTLLITSAVSILTVLMQVGIPNLKEVLISDQKKMLIKAKEEERFKKFKDSIIEIEDLKTQKNTYSKISAINDYMDNLRRSLPYSAYISLYFTHDSGGVPVSGSQLNVTILQSDNNLEPCLGKSYWQDKAIPDGYFNYAHRILRSPRGFVYVPDIYEDTEIYTNETKEDLDCNNTKSMMGIIVKQTGFGIYFISVGWTHKNPLEKNPMARQILKKYGSLIEPLIEGKKR